MSSFQILEVLDAESVYYYDSTNSDIISSVGNRFRIRLQGKEHDFSIPINGYLRPFLASRLARRALRLDMANAVINHTKSGVVILYQGGLYFYHLQDRLLSRVGGMRQCRNVLYGSIAVTSSGIYFGEYGSNSERAAVPIWCSRDDGLSWRIAYEFPQGSIKHVHGVYKDPYTDYLWVATGDFENECFLYRADENFSKMQPYGDGNQEWRPVSLLFEKEKILWGMDSQLQTSYLMEFDREKGTLARSRSFPGPVWYTKQFSDGSALLQSTVELGPGVLSKHAHLFGSSDNREWKDLAQFKKDRWPMRFFKFGVLAFADGPQTPDNFVLFGEGLVGMDGKAVIASVEF